MNRIVALKLAELATRVDRARSHCPATPDELASDPDALDLVSFNLQLAVQLCTDIAAHLISSAGWRVPDSTRGAFERLREHGVITLETERALKHAVGLRNVVANAYGTANPAWIHAAASTGLTDLERFASEVAAWMTRSDA